MLLFCSLRIQYFSPTLQNLRNIFLTLLYHSLPLADTLRPPGPRRPRQRDDRCQSPIDRLGSGRGARARRARQGSFCVLSHILFLAVSMVYSNRSNKGVSIGGKWIIIDIYLLPTPFPSALRADITKNVSPLLVFQSVIFTPKTPSRNHIVPTRPPPPPGDGFDEVK